MLQMLFPLQSGELGSKIKNAKSMRKTILQERYSCFVQKNGSEKHQISAILQRL